MRTIVCENCDLEVPRVWDDVEIPELGLYFSPQSMGYYSGFFDNFPPDDEEKDGYYVCHDCSVTLMTALPGLARRLMPQRGGHPNKDFTHGTQVAPCCAWAWVWDEAVPCSECGAVTVYLANHEGGWDEKNCPCGQVGIL